VPEKKPANKSNPKFSKSQMQVCLRNISFVKEPFVREIIGLFCKRALSKRQCSAKETYNFKEPTKGEPDAGMSSHHIFCKRAL